MGIKPSGIKSIIGIAAASVVAGSTILTAGASSHNDAPLIAEDPAANNTDVYAFVSTEEGRSDYVTLISNFIPMQDPGNGPTHSRFSDRVRYEIKVDVDGDAEADLTYQFKFKNNIVNGKTFLYNTDAIGLPPYPSDPTSQYQNLNVQQSYTLTEVVHQKKGDQEGAADRDQKDDHDQDGTYGSNDNAGRRESHVLVRNARVAPANVGPKSTPDYASLAEAAIHPLPGGGKVFVGPRDEGFYIDLMGFFDLVNLRGPDQAVDTFDGFNVHTLALEIPKERFARGGDTDGIIGIWSSASRPKTTVLQKGGRPAKTSDGWVQVSRLGNPLVNELLMPLDRKDLFNATRPKDDAKNIADFIVNPGNSQSAAAIIPVLNRVTGCTPVNDRADLDLVLLKGIPAGTLGLPGNQDTQREGGPVTGDLLRLNYNVAPAGDPSPLGVLGGDVAGFPNGRRVGDDVADIFARAGAGAVLHLLGAIDCPISLEITDYVQHNDVPYLDSFPYLGTPHQGFSHQHGHATGSMMAMATGFGLVAGGLALGSVLVVRKRRDRLTG
ncbi:MAG TPA: DUF4331 domain-containing protein [Dehalococcoidia bacterium]|nr:DUF4331 domain-containing protein [Dehalococcoidia bacterium]